MYNRTISATQVSISLIIFLAIPLANAYVWKDCLEPEECDDVAGCLHFRNITSFPDPVIQNGQPQTVIKHGTWTGKEDITALECYFQQFYKVFDRWIPFLKITTDFCKDHPGKTYKRIRSCNNISNEAS